MAPAGRKRASLEELDPAKIKFAGVMILLLKSEKRWVIPLILRHEYQGVHSGQVSLPGGSQENADNDLSDTALRECVEETGFSSRIKILGKLTGLYIPVSNYFVEPYVAYSDEVQYSFSPDPREVNKLLLLGIDQLKDASFSKKGWVDSDRMVNAPYFQLEEYRVWGATAMILSEFREIVGSIS